MSVSAQLVSRPLAVDLQRPCRAWYPGGLSRTGSNAALLGGRLALSRDHVLPGTGRITIIAHLVEQGVDISIVQALLGHTHLSTTIRYISVATRTIAAVKSPLDHLEITVPEMRPQQELTPSG
jgi:integrase